MSSDNFQARLDNVAKEKRETAEALEKENQDGDGNTTDIGDDKSDSKNDKGNPVIELNDESVLKYIREKTQKEVKSFDELFVEKEVVKETPYASEHAKKYDEFYKETSGTVEEFNFIQQDIDKKDGKDVVREILSIQNPNMDKGDIDFMMTDQFSYNEDSDEDNDIRRKQVAFKQKESEARQILKGRQEKWKTEAQAPVDSEAVIKGFKQKEKDQFDSFSNDWIDNLKEATKGFDGLDVAVKDEDGTVMKDVNIRIASDTESSKTLFNTVADVSFQEFTAPFRDEEGKVNQKGLHEAIFKMNNFDKAVQLGVEKGIELGLEKAMKERVNPRASNLRQEQEFKVDKNATQEEKLKQKVRKGAARKINNF